MKKRRVAVAVIAIGLACSGLYLWVAELEHVVIHASRSPGGEREALLHTLGEGDSIPYGTQLVVYSALNPLGKYLADPLFRGYCNGPSDLFWESDATLVLRCGSYEGVELRRDSYRGVTVRYETEQSREHESS